MHGIELPKGMKESTQFIPPLFTPSTKAELGDKDENIHPDKRELLPPSCPSPSSSAALFLVPPPQLKPTNVNSCSHQFATSSPTPLSPSLSNPTPSPSTRPPHGTPSRKASSSPIPSSNSASSPLPPTLLPLPRP